MNENDDERRRNQRLLLPSRGVTVQAPPNGGHEAINRYSAVTVGDL